MTIFRFALCLFAGLMMVAMAQPSHAQRPAHFYPARPAFSTYLLYRQFNGTGIPNYYQFVRPATQYRDFISRRRPATAFDQRQQLISIESEVARALDTQIRQRVTTGIGQPSVPATFNDTQQFYPDRSFRRR